MKTGKLQIKFNFLCEQLFPALLTEAFVVQELKVIFSDVANDAI